MRIIISLTSLFLILMLVSASCSTSDPPAPIYTPHTGDMTTITSNIARDNSGLPSPSASEQPAELNWSNLINLAHPLISDILPVSGINLSDEESMTLFRDKLVDKGVAAGLVKIDSRLGANGNLNYCVAVNTLDKGIVFLYVLPKGLEISNEDNRLQEVYLKNGERVGLLSAIYATSSDYSWYVNYLEETYANWDYGEYITEFGNIVDENKKELDKLSSKIDELIDFAENPNISIYDSTMPQAQIDAKYNSLLGEVDALIDRYNSYPDRYNAQVEEYNAKLNSYIIESEKYPYELFYVEEYSINPNRISFPISPIPMPTLIPYIPVPIAPFSLYTIDTYLDALQTKVSRDYSYNLLPEPDETDFKTERITDKNFIVNDFKIKW